jgi:hypothetical protein
MRAMSHAAKIYLRSLRFRHLSGAHEVVDPLNPQRNFNPISHALALAEFNSFRIKIMSVRAIH